MKFIEYSCYYCCKRFKSKEDLEEHKPLCYTIEEFARWKRAEISFCTFDFPKVRLKLRNLKILAQHERKETETETESEVEIRIKKS